MKPKPTKYTEADRKYLRLVSESPTLTSFLYDLNLLPEQLEKDSKGWQAMKLVIGGYVIGKNEGK